MALSHAVDRYLYEPPPLQRLSTKTRPPLGYVRYGPKDAPEAIAECLQAEEAPVAPTRATTRPRPVGLSVKAGQNQQELDEAVYLYSADLDERRKLKGHGQLQDSEPSGHQGHPEKATSPVQEPTWHALARTQQIHPAQAEPSTKDKRRSQPLRKVPRRIRDQACSTGLGQRARRAKAEDSLYIRAWTDRSVPMRQRPVQVLNRGPNLSEGFSLTLGERSPSCHRETGNSLRNRWSTIRLGQD